MNQIKGLCVCVCLSVCSLLRYSELGTGCGWFYSSTALFLGKGRSFTLLLLTIGSERPGGGKAKVPGAVTRSLLTTPRGGKITTFQEIPPRVSLSPPTHPPQNRPCLVNIQHHHNVQKLKVLFTVDFHSRCNTDTIKPERTIASVTLNIIGQITFWHRLTCL